MRDYPAPGFLDTEVGICTPRANQVRIVIRNAQLYTQVVLASEYTENIVATIESG
jgi:hypothetical protein